MGTLGRNALIEVLLGLQESNILLIGNETSVSSGQPILNPEIILKNVA